MYNRANYPHDPHIYLNKPDGTHLGYIYIAGGYTNAQLVNDHGGADVYINKT